MKLQLATPDARIGGPAPPRGLRARFDRFELAMLCAFAGLSVWVLALDLYQVVAHGRVWTGTDGFFVVDQLQYLAWISAASHHLLASNLFVLQPTPADYFQPAVAISGLISAAGVPPWLSLLLWKPVAVVAMFLAVRAYARTSLPGLWSRRAVLALGLFFASFTILYGQVGVVGDLLPGFLSWGYTFGLMAIAAMLAAIVAYDGAQRTGRRRLLPAFLGLTAGLLHPWQGELLIVVIAGSEAVAWWRGDRGARNVLWREPRRAAALLRLPAVTLAACALPLLYYGILGRADMSWGLARENSRHDFSLWSILLALAPLALPALLGLRLPARGFLDLATRVWPLAALLIYVLSASRLSATPLHAFEGITVPLAVLAVQGTRASAGRLRLPRRHLLAIALVLVATVPATAYELSVAHEFMAPQPGNANFITRDERDALAYLAHDPVKGGVLTRFYLGALVPGRTGRRTFVGHCLWSEPGCVPRAQAVQQLFDGSMSRPAARSFVSSTGARFALADCQEPNDLREELGRLIVSVERFGCATVYELDPALAAGIA